MEVVVKRGFRYFGFFDNEVYPCIMEPMRGKELDCGLDHL
ncbi:hypothetical protein ACINIS116_0732 [Acinetobacter baumannii IS-116]|nr:hypothetical protein ACINIS116_0732 [Acinetobacter baumannii IS-116]